MSSRDPERAVTFMLENATVYAQAKANRIQLEQFLKSKKAILMTQCNSKTVSERECYAYAHSEYLEVINGLREAVFQEEKTRVQLKAAELTVEIWRSQEATARAEGKATQ